MKNLLFALLTIFAFMRCDSKSDETKPVVGEPLKLELTFNEQQIADEGLSFGMKLFSSVLKTADGADNVVVSPLSLNIALAMVWNGADGDTRDAIQEAIGMSQFPADEVNAYFKKLKEALLKTDPTTKLALANSIWAHKDFPVKQSFYDLNSSWYDAKVSVLDFRDASTPTVINRWCSDNTNGLIKEMLQTIPTDAVMYLMNALYFKGIWAEGCGFDKKNTKNEAFQKDDGKSLTVSMMYRNSHQLYYEDEHLELAALPYGNRAFRMVFLLPVEGTVEELAEKLTEEGYLSECLKKAYSHELNLYIPKFKTEYEADLNKPLTALGMGVAFDALKADFSGISDVDIFVTKVKQKAYINVDEEGTEAAAVTGVEMGVTSVGPGDVATFRADRPFIYLIQETSTGAILFIGKSGAPMP
jgi:serpin B